MSTSPDWSFADLLAATGGIHAGGSPRPITGFSIDSRSLAPGEVFVAFKGERTDGHAYIAQALAKGAAAIVSSRWIEGAAPAADDPAWIRCDDPLRSLQDAARYHRARHKALFIGVTGSNGKTTTKEMLLHLFSGVSKTWATAGNFNNDIGLPLSLVRIPLETETAIIEMGMNHAGEIRFLAGIARPHAAIITNIGPAHIGNLGSLENIALAKAEILEGLGPDGLAVLPGDDPWLSTLRSKTRARVVCFGFGLGCDCSGQNVTMEADAISMEIVQGGSRTHARLGLLGRHNALNALGALALFVGLGRRPLAEGVALLERFRPVAARMESHEVDGKRVILDCYNANPSSMKQAIEYLAVCKGRRVAVLGDMRELGDQSEALHRELGASVARLGLDRLVAVGEQAQFIAQAALQAGMTAIAVHPCGDVAEAAKLLETLLLGGDTVLLKASRGMHFESIVKALWPSLPCDLH
ncbi:MAG TPA: UDP-N-acetylmuramoyl-tripeptide--D-alanyl-D-alanine ligase [Candidatus Ozemobacteraceae bacterium]|nr:UDP-N-acetylmuramoyl-tripeptide--D-alanyl-D-alanine ligase [Candidatus Ozemobacteraceae bacterium]